MKCPYGKNIHIVGVAGTEGSAILNYISQKYPGVQIVAHDYSVEKEFLKHFKESHSGIGRKEAVEEGRRLLEMPEVTFCFRDEYLNGIDQADTIFVPQSWYLYDQNEPLKAHFEKFCSITKLYFDLFPGKIIGVTGSNGKTTTTSLIAEIMQRYYPSTMVSGNDRRSFQVLDRIEEASSDDWLVLEISNRQLMIDLGKSPDISVITNITPNHLTEYKSFEEYVGVKRSLIQYQQDNQIAVLNRDDEESRKINEHHDGASILVSHEEPLSHGVYEQFGNIVLKTGEEEEIVMPVADFPLKGKHNVANALQAIAVCHHAGVPLDEIAQTLRSVEPVPQRLELIGEVNGVEYYNDSASTVPESTFAAIEALQEEGKKLVLISGGKSKGSDYVAFAKQLKPLELHLIGIESPVLDELKDLDLESVKSLTDAVQLASQKTSAGDKVLLSPAAEYFSYFRGKLDDYKMFRDLVGRL